MAIIGCAQLSAQQKTADSLKPNELSEVIVIGRKAQLYQKQNKPLMAVEEYLRQSGKVEMVRRGAYAWEPMINNMATERTVVTIDGMRVFGACTDKMDPITSYVEVSNLSEANINSGVQGNCHGAAIGGSLDLRRNRGTFATKGWNASLNSGYETNGNQRILGTTINYAGSSFYADTDLMYRKSDNYMAGNQREVAYSQFGKFNVSATSGVLFHKNKIIEASVIYDKATNVGYPALPMDVSLAEALITSFKFDYLPKAKTLKDWETKLYFNTITHRMDDTQRPFVPIHMDMPGWSKTYGFYSKLSAALGPHQFTIDANAFYNEALATMTMYPADPNENSMFMETWPDVHTRYTAVFAQDQWALNCHSYLKFSATVASHANTVSGEMGLESLRIFFPDMKARKIRTLKSFSGTYGYNRNHWEYQAGLAFGERAPSVSEGYGFYLFNSFDRYDYIGNPELKNEKSLQAHSSVGYKTTKTAVKFALGYFSIFDYIIAKPDHSLIPMTIGASGVKRTTALNGATVLNAECNMQYQINDRIRWKGLLVYNYGQDDQGVGLPFVSPLRYNSAIAYKQNKFNADLAVEGNLTQTQYSPSYGEDRTPAYAILNFSGGYVLSSGKYSYRLNAGIENLLDAYYSTFSDWNNIPRKGRNCFVNFSFSYN